MDNNDVQKFHNAYIYKDENELDRLWQEDAPKTLIKFFSAKYDENGMNYFLKHIKEQTIWLASPSTFNDPFDCVINIDMINEVNRIAKDTVQDIIDEEMSKIFFDSHFAKTGLEKIYINFKNNFTKEHRDFEKRIYVICFSEPDNLYSLRMWGHYANNHCGVCAEYDFNTVKNISPFACIPVMYTDTYSYKFDTKEKEEKTKNILNLMYTKAHEWEYEKEWRAAYCLDKSKGRGFDSTCGLPKRVYLGCKAPEKLREDIINLCRNNGVEVFQMKLKPESYKLVFDKTD